MNAKLKMESSELYWGLSLGHGVKNELESQLSQDKRSNPDDCVRHAEEADDAGARTEAAEAPPETEEGRANY